MKTGQPNVEYVRDVLEAMVGNDRYNVASVLIAKKREFVPLQPADFLAHCCGTHETGWLAKLRGKKGGRVLHGHYSAEQLKDVSEQVEEIKRQYRHRKRQAKIAAKAQKAGLKS